MDNNSSQDSIQVFIRIRPSKQQQSVLAYTDNEIKLDKHQFAFDKIFNTTCSQTQIFSHVGTRLLNNVMDGYNSCVFVYGQTGSGKTHTMIGQNNGLMQQSFKQLFSRINRMKHAQCFVTCSYFQLYNEQIMDLLDPKKQKKLNIRQDSKKGVFVQNLTQQTALDCDKLMEVLYTGMKNRHIGETQMNHESSRSHSVFTISLSCKVEQDGKKILKTPKLHFVDLAGSERQKMTQASGDRLKQAGNINKSLTTLGMVINALTSQKPRSHIPYRDSKLTCLLRDSLGGNSKTIIIATVSCAYLSFQETLSTLNFANRAKMVKVKALINEESLSSNIQVYKEQIRRLKSEIMRLKTETRTPIKVISHQIISPKQVGTEFQQHFEQINKKITAISQQLSQGVSSPSLQALLTNLNKPNAIKISSVDTMMQQQNCQMESNGNPQKYNYEFIEYLNSNYELLTQINSKINQYVQMKSELRNVAMNKKLAIENMRTPSKFERDQYQELLNRRQAEIKQLQQKVQQIQDSLNLALIEKKDAQRKLHLYSQQKGQNQSQVTKFKQCLLIKQQQLQKVQATNQKLKSNQLKLQKNVEQLELRLKQTKQLYLYSEEKYENQQFTTNKLCGKIKELEYEMGQVKKQCEFGKEEKRGLENQIEKLKLIIQEKQSAEEEIRNQINTLEETLEFNKRIIHDLTKKSAASNNEMAKHKQLIQQLQINNSTLLEEKQFLIQKLQNQTNTYQSLLEQKSHQIKQYSAQNDKLLQKISQLNKQITVINQNKEIQHQKMREEFTQLRSLIQQKQSEILKAQNQMFQMEAKISQIKNEKEACLQNYNIKLQARVIECQMLEAKYNEYKQQSQNLVSNLRKQLQSLNVKLSTLETQYSILSSKNENISMQLKQALTKLKSVFHILEQNQQLKKSYKQLVKQNYRLKGKYKSTQNEQFQKQKNQELMSKVQYYEEKFKLMSIEYQQITETVKKLKQKELEANKKIQYYQESLKLSSIQKSDEIQEKNNLIKELKEENRQLKYKFDNLESNMTKQQYQEKHKKMKDERENNNFSLKVEKFRSKMISIMKKWDGFNSQNQYSTEQIIDLCQHMIDQHAIKFETIAKGIRRQQKLKSQNHFILKQNIYLKERMEALQKNNLNIPQEDPRPRKIVKTQQV